MGKIVGYLRVSTDEQSADRQIDGLADLCDELHVEYVSARAATRPIYERATSGLRSGDTLIVWDLDRGFRSVVDAITELEKLQARGVRFRIVNLNVDTTTPNGMLIYTIVSAVAQHERSVLIQRTKEGMAAARKRGVRLGRPPKLTDAKLAKAEKLLADGVPHSTVARRLKVAPWSLTRALRRRSPVTDL